MMPHSLAGFRDVRCLQFPTLSILITDIFIQGCVFFQPTSILDILPVTDDCTLALEVKSTVLFHRASRMAHTFQHTANPLLDEMGCAEYAALERTLIAFIASIPPWDSSTSTSTPGLISLKGTHEDEKIEAQAVMYANDYLQYVVPTIPAFVGVNRSMMNVHIRAHAALMELMHAAMIVGYDTDAWGKCVNSAAAVAWIVREIKYEMSPCLIDAVRTPFLFLLVSHSLNFSM